nr:B3 domain-containing transcription repressor VAL1-like isoform X1 [Tanacetum cinerariifolium]
MMMMMTSPGGVKVCVNELCGTTTTSQWKRGWAMKVGGFASLCYSCGTAFDNLCYCERFHLNEAGWRECKFCEKPIHCGCIVSKYLYECLDMGGIACMKCMRAKGTQPFNPPSLANKIQNGFTRFSGSFHPSVFTNRMNNSTLTPLSEGLDKSQHACLTSSIGQPFRLDEELPSYKEFGARCSSSKDLNLNFRSLPTQSLLPTQSPLPTVPDNNKPSLGSQPINEPVYQQSLGFSFGNESSSVVPTSNGVVERNVILEKVPSVKQEQKPRQMVPKISKSGASIRSQSNKETGSDNRVARPPGEGRGRSQLLPRYWPRMTDQELLQISGDLNSNCTITPLFEKVLSASDAGKIGRLVLPKACAEAYFPVINSSEGVPVKVRDVKGKEWTFQFRYWPNNNSRMYVLEGVFLCIQNMQMEAGDTVIFSRLNPGDKLVLGCRKAVIATHASAPPNPVNGDSLASEPILPKIIDQGTSNLDSEQKSVIQEKKKTHNIGSKSKRLHMHSEDAMDLKFTWEEAQECLRPPSNPTVVTIENCELEEYDEPPVFGKKTIFTTTASRLQEQWVQCDSCSKWRKLPSDALIASKWTCSDNVSDPNRCSCSTPEERGAADLEQISKRVLSAESKKQKLVGKWGTKEQKQEATGLDALATVAILGANDSENGNSIVGPTTRHPRHRPGCSCIVCIQPPSGKGKHKPNCTCNVCATVRRRFKTMMQRKKNRQVKQGAEKVNLLVPVIDKTEPDDALGTETGPEILTESSDKGQGLDLNLYPKEEGMMLAASRTPPVWQNVRGGRVPNVTSELKDRPVQKINKVVEGIVVRDSTGSLCYVHGDLSCAESALYVEIIAIHSACLFTSNHGWLNSIVESDSQMNISLSSSEAHPPWRFATLIDDIRLW